MRLRTRITPALVALTPFGAFAHTPTAELEQIVVTGSRIARPDFESASPIVTITQEAFERTGSTSVEAVVSRLPQFSPSFGATSNNPSQGGQGNVQLRGLGEVATLVLVDGRRLIPANGNGVVDVNIIPASLIESVEVISGGASAVYGSDAIAGVVNFKLKHDFEGLQFDGSWGQTDRGDGEEYSAGITGGLSFADGRGDLFGFVGYSERADVFQRARRFSEVSLAYFGPGQGSRGPDMGFDPTGSPNVPDGTVAPTPPNRPSRVAHDALFAKYGYAPGTVPYPQRYGFNADGTLFTMGNRSPNSIANFRGVQDPNLASDRLYSYNFGPVNYLLLPLEQVSAFGRASFELSDAVEFFVQALHSDYSADTALAPTPAMNLRVPVTNPYIPDDYQQLLASRANPAAPFDMAKRFDELGPRISSNQHDAWQGTFGVQGRVFGDWQYDAYVQVGAYDQDEHQQGNTLRSTIMDLAFAPDGGVAACGGLDLFGPESVSKQCAQYIAVDATNRQGYDQSIVEASLTGAVASLPAGELSIAVGAMYKHDEFFYRADSIGSVFLEDGFADIQGFNASKDIEGSDHNTDLYVEALVPLLAGVPGVERLEAGLGYRYSDYASAGGVDSYKAELLYLPVDVLRVRTSYQRAVRAPSVYELYLPQLPSDFVASTDPNFGLSDPCVAGSAERGGPDAAQVEALCLAQGLPAALLPDYEVAEGTPYPGVIGGNPLIGPETADTITLGFVLQSWSDSAWLSGLRVSVDWYRIEVDDAIVQASAFNYVPQCFDRRANPTFDASHELCRLFSRDPETGDLTGLMDLNQNFQSIKVSGIDTQLDWRFPAGPGDVGINWLLSWLEEFDTVDYPGLPTDDAVSRIGRDIGASSPEWKWNFNLSYDWQALTVAAQWRHIDGMRDIDWDYEIPRYDYLDLYAGYAFESGLLAGLTLRGGVENLADQQPPLIPTPVAANTDPSQYDVLGRRYFVSASYRF